MATPAKIRKRTANFKIEFSGDETKKVEILEKMRRIRNRMAMQENKPIGNLQVLEALLDKWLDNEQEEQNERKPEVPSSFINVNQQEANQMIFLCAIDSFKKCIEVVQTHARLCTANLSLKKVTQRGHVIMSRLQCELPKHPHSYLWSSSPYLPNMEYLVNNRVNHGLICSGMLPSHYTRFSQGAKIGIINSESRTKFSKSYSSHVQAEYNDSVYTGLLEEVESYEDDRLGQIDIMTDARHGWRKNAKDTSVVAVGERTHKVISCQHVTKQDDHVSQRHEKIGTKRIYDYLDHEDTFVGIHTHDRNLSINKYVREECDSYNQNDTWHAVKNVKSAIQKLTSGPLSQEGKTWFFDLHDKTEPIVTHFYWAIKNCEEDAEKLKAYLINIPEHYKNIHEKCHQDSRCKKDPNYEISRVVMKNPKAEKALINVIKNSNIYKHPEDYILGKDTFYVESFNNVMNIFQDKRISFSDIGYNMRSHLAVCHWNENVDREYTSVWKPGRNPHMPRTTKGKKNYKKCTFKYRENIWKRYLSKIYHSN